MKVHSSIDVFAPSWRLLVPAIGRELRMYGKGKFYADAQAAATVAMISIPQAVGFALIAGLPPTMVMASVIVGGFVASLYFSSRSIVFGPSNSLSLLLASTLALHRSPAMGPAEMAVVLAILIGTAQLLAGLFRLCQITQFVSRSVVIGYGAAIGVLLIFSQLHHLVGVEKTTGTVQLLAPLHIVSKISAGGLNTWALATSAATFGMIWVLKRVLPKAPETLLAMIFFSVYSKYCDLTGFGVKTLGTGISFAGTPNFGGLEYTAYQFTTVSGLLVPALAIALLGMLEAVAIAKTYSIRSGERIDTNREMVAMGMGNLITASFGGMPGSASFARSAANFQAAAKTQVAGALSSVFVLGIIVLLAPLIVHLPLPALAAALVWVGIRMIDRRQIKIAFRSTGSDAIVLVGTFGSAFIMPLDTAIYIGVALSLALALRKASTPVLVEYTFNSDNELIQSEPSLRRVSPSIAIIHVEGELFFGAADLFHDNVRTQVESENLRVVILRLKNARHLDATTIFALHGLIDYFRLSGRHLLISGVHGDVLRVLQRSGLVESIGRENIFPAELNPNLATRAALMHAQALLCSTEAKIRIYGDTSAHSATV